MKIAIIKNYFRPYVIGGAEINVDNLATSLATRDNTSVVVVTMGERVAEEEEIPGRLKIVRFRPWNLYFPFPIDKKRNLLLKAVWWIVNLWNPVNYVRIKRILTREKPDIVQLHNFYGISISVISAVSSLGIPIVFFPHDFFLVCKNSSFMGRGGKICSKRCWICVAFTRWNRIFTHKIATTVFLSRYSANVLQRHHPLHGPVIHNACMVSLEVIAANRAKRIALGPGTPVQFLYMGRLDRHKGILTLLKAWQEVHSEDARLVIAGEGAYVDRVQQISSADRRVSYVGFVSGEEKERLLLGCHVFLFTSEWAEVSPIVIQEAFAFGLPVLATDMGSIPEHISNNENGLLFPTGDWQKLGELIISLTYDKDRINRMSLKCTEQALSNGYKARIDRICDIHKHILKSANRRNLR